MSKRDDTANETIFTDKDSTGGFCGKLNVLYNINVPEVIYLDYDIATTI